MYNVILTKKDGTELYISSNGRLVTEYDENNAIQYEFEDYEDAENIKIDYVLDHWQDEDADEVANIQVVQM